MPNNWWGGDWEYDDIGDEALASLEDIFAYCVRGECGPYRNSLERKGLRVPKRSIRKKGRISDRSWI